MESVVYSIAQPMKHCFSQVTFTTNARKSKLWRSYVPDDVVCDEDLTNTELSGEHFPLVWKRPR